MLEGHDKPKPFYDDVVIVCPEGDTGGTEALHQLGFGINELGGQAHIAYVGDHFNSFIAGGYIECVKSSEGFGLNAFDKYNPRILGRLKLTPKTLVVFPEVHALQAFQFKDISRAIWWLSVDNAIERNPLLGYDSIRKPVFSGDEKLLHFYQSDYARDFLRKGHATKLFPLFDYIDRDYCVVGSNETERERKYISYFPRKGGNIAAKFISDAGSLNFKPIQNMSRLEVKNALKESAIYIDFGHHPGKDRVPREAAACGALVFLHERGAATFYADHPVDPQFLFNLMDLHNGSLLARVTSAVANYETLRQTQNYYRQRIRVERDEFYSQIRCLFFEG